MLASTALKVLIVMTSHAQLGESGRQTGYWLSEVSHTYSVFEKAGFQIEFVSPRGGTPPVDPGSLDMSDPLNVEFLENPDAQEQLSQTLTPGEVKAEDYRAIYFAGGHGTMWDFPNNPDLARIAETIYSRGGVVSGVCHGVSAFLGLRSTDGNALIRGKRMAGFSNAEEQALELDSIVPFPLQDALVSDGGLYENGPLWESFVVQDQRVVSGQNPNSSAEVARQVSALLNGK